LEGLIRRASELVQEVLGRPRPTLAEEAEDRDFKEAIAIYRGSGAVLVVEDEDPLRAAAAEALRRIGYDPLEARDGLEALQVFEANRDRIRIILMDLTMPGMDGEEAYRQLRAHGMLVPVLLTSGFSETEVLHHFRSRGIAGFLQKPYRLQTLARMVWKAMERDQPGQTTHLALRRPLLASVQADSGLPLLDQQHRLLAKAFEHLVASLDLAMPWREQTHALATLKEVALTHFGVEETLMDRLAYPRTRDHQQSHARLIKQINELTSRIQHRTLHLSPALLDFLEGWLVHHMQDEDRLLTQFAKGQGH
jgi:hemerythrin-like metal-binding protein